MNFSLPRSTQYSSVNSVFHRLEYGIFLCTWVSSTLGYFATAYSTVVRRRLSVVGCSIVHPFVVYPCASILYVGYNAKHSSTAMYLHNVLATYMLLGGIDYSSMYVGYCTPTRRRPVLLVIVFNR